MLRYYKVSFKAALIKHNKAPHSVASVPYTVRCGTVKAMKTLTSSRALITL